MVGGPQHTPPIDLTPPSVEVDGYTIDPCRILVPLTITIGRSDVSQQPSAPSASWSMLGLPGPLRIGQPVTIAHRADRQDVWSDIWADEWGGDPTPVSDVWSDTWDDVWSQGPWQSDVVRMRGHISDMEVEREGDTITTSVVVTGVSAALAGRIGDEPWPEQVERARVARIASLLPDVEVRYVGPISGESHSVRRLDVDSRTALDVLQSLASGTGALLVEMPDGWVAYQSQAWRDENRPSTLLIDEYAILDRTGWQAQPVANAATVAYGYQPVIPDPQGGESTTLGPRPIVSDREPLSIAQYGEQSVTIDSEWVKPSSASALAARVVHQRAWEAWEAPQVMLPMHLQSSLQAWRETVVGLQPGARITLRSVTSDPSPPGGVGDWIVEGWVETWDRIGEADRSSRVEHWMQLAVSPAGPWRADVMRTSVHVEAEYLPDHPEGPHLHVVASWAEGAPKIISPAPEGGPWPELRVIVAGTLVARAPAPAGIDAYVPIAAGPLGRVVQVTAQSTHIPGYAPAWGQAQVFVPPTGG